MPPPICSKAMLVVMTTSLMAITAPVCASTPLKQAPQQLQVPTLSADDSSLMLVWKSPENTHDIVDYLVYADGKMLGKASENNDRFSAAKPYINHFYANDKDNFSQRILIQNFKVTGLKPDSPYSFTVKSLYSNGSVSDASNRITAKTAPLPTIIAITDFGAKGDGVTLNTQAIQQAIDACPPGCRVDVPSGVYKTGALWLKSNMTLNLQAGSTLLGSEDPADYPPAYRLYSYSSEMRPASLINAIDPKHMEPGTFRNIRIVGPGSIDGNGWLRQETPEIVDEMGNHLPQYISSRNSKVHEDGILAKHQVAKAVAEGVPLQIAYGQRRSSLITLRGAENVYLADFTVRNPAFHGIMLLESHNVVANNLTHQTFDANNGDGIEFGNSQNVMVMNNFFDTGDDCINFAAGTGEKALEQPSMKGAWLFNNYLRRGHGAVVTGSHTGAWIEDILAENNVIYLTDVGLRAKSTTDIGGGARNIIFRNNAMKDIVRQPVILTLNYSDPNAKIDYPAAKKPAQFYHFLVQNVTVQGTLGNSPAIEIKGNSDKNAWHRQVHFDNVHFNNVPPTAISDLEDSRFDRVVFSQLRGDTPWHFNTVRNVTIDSKPVTP
ncbi:glycosyl hydrolase family 28 protein [Serratia sp. L9]|uniref:glycosyl hydrolase family 28 protein n=1 Tax=Serratia sp. L9 TaxID=3423946 RepID=UPI003D666A3E